MIKRTFLWKNNGWLPAWMPASAGFIPIPPHSPSVIAHDIFEHLVYEDGSMHFEVMAHGRMLMTRGSLDSYGVPNFSDALLHSVVQFGSPNVLPIRNPPLKTPVLSPQLENFLDDVISDCLRRTAEKTLARSYSMPINYPSFPCVMKFKDWMRFGFLDAKKRYPKNIAQIFYLTCDELLKHQSRVSENGDQMTVIVDLASAKTGVAFCGGAS